jgi:hypothetical protein
MAADSFWAGGSGVIVLPCGAGKTMVGAACGGAEIISVRNLHTFKLRNRQ